MSLLFPVFCWGQEATPIQGSEIAGYPIDVALDRIKEHFGCKLNFERQGFDTLTVVKILPNELNMWESFHWALAKTPFTFMYRPKRSLFVLRAREKGRFSISGQLFEPGEPKIPVPNAFIKPARSRGFVQSGEDGYFSLKVLPNDTLLIFRYGIASTMVAVDSNKNYYRIPIEVAAATIETEPIIDNFRSSLWSEPTLMEARFGASLTEINIQEIPGLGSRGEVDVIGATEILPGVTFNSESLSERSFHGGGYDQNGVTLDGINVIQPYHNLGSIGLFSEKAIGRAQVQYQGFGAQSGRRIASNMVLTAQPTGDTLLSNHLGYGQTLLTAHVYGRRGIENKKNDHLHGGLMGSYRRSFADIWVGSPMYNQLVNMRLQVTPVATQGQVDGQEGIASPRVFFEDASAKVSVPLSKRDRLSVTLLGSRDNIQYRVSQSDTDRTLDDLRVDQVGSSATYEHLWGKIRRRQPFSQVRFSQSYFQKKYSYLWDRQNGQDSLFQSNRMNELTLSSFHTLPLNDEGDLTAEFGTEWTYLRANQQGQFIRNDILLRQDSFDTPTLLLTQFGQVHFNRLLAIGTTKYLLLDATLGLRHTYHSMINRHYYEPRFIIEAEYEQWRVRAAAGRYKQFVTQAFTQYPLNLGEELLYIADEDSLTAPGANQLNASISYQTQKFWSFSAQAYLKQFDGISTYAFSEIGNLPSFDINDLQILTGGTGFARGMDLILRYNNLLHDTWVSYSLSKVTYSFDELLDNAAFPAEQDQRHQLKVVNKIWITRNLTTSILWTYASGRPFTEVSEVDNQRLLYYGPVNQERLPAYHRLDLGMEYKFALSAANTPSARSNPVMARVGFSLFNVYNRINISQRRYRVGESIQGVPQVFALDYQLLGISPNLFLNLEF